MENFRESYCLNIVVNINTLKYYRKQALNKEINEIFYEKADVP